MPTTYFSHWRLSVGEFHQLSAWHWNTSRL